jgi:hypothetical protein
MTGPEQWMRFDGSWRLLQAGIDHADIGIRHFHPGCSQCVMLLKYRCHANDLT